MPEKNKKQSARVHRERGESRDHFFRNVVINAVCVCVSALCLPVANAATFTVFGPEVFTRASGPPVEEIREFSVANPSANFTLIITNGGLENDEDTGESVSSGSISLNGMEILGTNGFNQNTDALSFPVELTPSNTLSVELRGKPGGSVRIEIVGESIDVTPPDIGITSPVSGALLLDAQPTIEIAFFDNDAVDLSSLVLSAAGNPLSVSCELESVGGSCVPTSALPEGDITIGATVTDLSGNTATATAAWRVDTIPVEVSIDTPASGLVTANSMVNVSGTLSGDVERLTVNGVDSSVGSGSFSATVALSEGRNTLLAVAQKASGRTSTDSVVITRDVAPPIVRITTPADGFVSVDEVLPVAGIVNDVVTGGVDTRVIVNGTEVGVSNGTFLLSELTLRRGSNVIEAVATDSVGNEGRHSITVRFENVVGQRIRIQSGNGQTAVVEENLGEPLIAVVTDDAGNPVAGRVVAFEVSGNSGVLKASVGAEEIRRLTAITNGRGEATAFLKLGNRAGQGSNRVLATAVGVVGQAEFCATALPGPADRILMTQGDNQRGMTSHPLPESLDVLVVDVHGNPLTGVEVNYAVEKGDGTVSNLVSAIVPTDNDGVASAIYTSGDDSGLNNNVVTAALEGSGILPVRFVASTFTPGDPNNTRFVGIVVDNAQTPIPGAIVDIVGTTSTAITDDNGQFILTDVPVGEVHLHIDPTNSPRPETFPPLEFPTVAIAGIDNTLTMPISLPAINTSGRQIVGGDQDVALTIANIDGFSITVLANSVTFPDGSRTGEMSVSQVHLDKVPMPPPNGSFFMPPAWTLQPAGVVFDPPARVTVPNDGLKPGEIINIYQFDHAINRFINVGPGTTTDDGRVIVSDPGFGITRAGWGGCGLPPPPNTEGEKDECDEAGDKAGEAAQESGLKFASIQECIAKKSCEDRQNQEDPDWLSKVVPPFVDAFVDGLNTPGSNWHQIANSEPCLSSPTGNLCTARMALEHISIDLQQSLNQHGCGTQSDWDRVGDILDECNAENADSFLEQIAGETLGNSLRDAVRNICLDQSGG